MASINKNKVSVLQAVAPVRALFHHLKLFFLIILALTILIVSRVDNDITREVRILMVDAATPILSFASSPIQSYYDLKENIQNMVFIYHENAQLQQENSRLKRLQSVALELEAENRRLRELLKFSPKTAASFVTARVVGNSANPYAKTTIINAGTNDGVQSGQVVTNQQGLIGRVSETGNKSARILLLTDINSRIPVITEESREHVVLAGNNTASPELIHLAADSNIIVGEKVMTSGDGKFFHESIPVGVVQAVSESAVVVKPFVNWGRLEYVTIADYEKNLMSEEKAEASEASSRNN